jgi:hypothetical protein
MVKAFIHYNLDCQLKQDIFNLLHYIIQSDPTYLHIVKIFCYYSQNIKHIKVLVNDSMFLKTDN